MEDKEEEKLLLEFGKRLKKLRKDKGLSFRQLSYTSDLSVSYIQKLEEGSSNPSFTTLLKLSEALEVELNEFVGKG